MPVTVQHGPPVTIMANEGELRRALGNLVANAIRHARTRVELAAELDQNEVVLSILDDGPGVPAEERERVFERFTRLDDARTRDSGGSGLGLPIARELVRRAGGEVSLVDADPPWAMSAEDPAAGSKINCSPCHRCVSFMKRLGCWHSCPLVC